MWVSRFSKFLGAHYRNAKSGNTYETPSHGRWRLPFISFNYFEGVQIDSTKHEHESWEVLGHRCMCIKGERLFFGWSRKPFTSSSVRYLLVSPTKYEFKVLKWSVACARGAWLSWWQRIQWFPGAYSGKQANIGNQTFLLKPRLFMIRKLVRILRWLFLVPEH